MYSLDEVKKVDPEVAQAIIDEENRQNSHIELIASENWVSKAVMAAMGSPLTNKYAEGYPGKRYYGGCECVDVIENLAIEGGSLDGAGNAEEGYIVRGGREMNWNYDNLWDMFQDVQALELPEGYSVLDEYRLVNDNDPNFSKA